MMLTALQGPQAPHQTFPTQSAAPVRTSMPTAPAELRPTDSVMRSAAVGTIPATHSFFSAPATSLDKALQLLNSAPTEEAYRKAQASFRIALRSLDLNALNQLQPSLDAQIKSSQKYRSQRFLADVQVDLFMEVHAKGGKPNIPPLTAPPSPGNTPEGVVQGSLRQLGSSLSEANYRTSRAGFRVAIRDLSVADLNKARALVQAGIQTSQDYRTQIFLDDLLEDVVMEQFQRGLKPEVPALGMPPALGKTATEIASKGLALLNSSPSEANYRTAIAAVRVASRGLDKAQLAVLKAELQNQMKLTSDYRTQIFLDQLSREMY